MFGLTATELTGMFGRFPVLFTHVNELQNVVHVTWKRWPGWLGVFPLKPPTPAYPTSAFCGLMATSWIGLFGRTAFPPVRLTQVAVFAVPVPRPTRTARSRRSCR